VTGEIYAGCRGEALRDGKSTKSNVEEGEQKTQKKKKKSKSKI
jgi:hypothetical protein